MLTVSLGSSGEAAQAGRGAVTGTSQCFSKEGWSGRWHGCPLSGGTVGGQRQKGNPGAGARELARTWEEKLRLYGRGGSLCEPGPACPLGGMFVLYTGSLQVLCTFRFL